MPRKLASRLVPVAVLLALSAYVDRAAADTISLTGNTAGSTEGLGNFKAVLSYSASSSTSATLGIQLTNTSPAANGGFLTGFVFNNPGGNITGVTLSATDGDFGLLGGSSFNNTINGAPFGQFDIGASTFGSFEGGGNPSKGIAVGVSETFTFSLTGTMLDALGAGSFVSELSAPPGAGEGQAFFVARFRGFEDGGSDKVPGGPGDEPPPPTPIPEPASLLVWTLLGLAGAGYGAARKRRRAKGAEQS